MNKTIAPRRRQIGLYSEYPGSYAWPIYEYKCPDCDRWTENIDGCIDGKAEDGKFYPLCKKCAEHVNYNLSESNNP